jgi:hypothetical protein
VNRIVHLGAKPIREGKAGISYTSAAAPVHLPALVFEKPGESPALARFRRRAAEELGAYIYRQLLDQAPITVGSETVTITVEAGWSADRVNADSWRLEGIAENELGVRLVRVRKAAKGQFLADRGPGLSRTQQAIAS